MPEQISKYPDVTLQILKDAGARCGEGMEQQILKKCPPERFCALPSGEICVYGINDIPLMTQVSTQEIARVVCPSGKEAAFVFSDLSLTALILIGAAFAVGCLVGGFRYRVRK